MQRRFAFGFVWKALGSFSPIALNCTIDKNGTIRICSAAKLDFRPKFRVFWGRIAWYFSKGDSPPRVACRLCLKFMLSKGMELNISLIRIRLQADVHLAHDRTPVKALSGNYIHSNDDAGLWWGRPGRRVGWTWVLFKLYRGILCASNWFQHIANAGQAGHLVLVETWKPRCTSDVVVAPALVQLSIETGNQFRSVVRHVEHDLGRRPPMRPFWTGTFGFWFGWLDVLVLRWGRTRRRIAFREFVLLKSDLGRAILPVDRMGPRCPIQRLMAWIARIPAYRRFKSSGGVIQEQQETGGGVEKLVAASGRRG